MGDLGNLKTDERGVAYLAMTDNQVKLSGELSLAKKNAPVVKSNHVALRIAALGTNMREGG